MSNVQGMPRNTLPSPYIQWYQIQDTKWHLDKKFLKYLHLIPTHSSICHIFERALINPTPTLFSTMIDHTEEDNMIGVAASKQDEIIRIIFFKGYLSKK